MEKIVEEFNDACRELRKASERYLEKTISIHDKISFYSGAVISLSITYLGYIYSLDVNVLNESVYLYAFGFPVICLLFTSWSLFSVCILNSLFIIKYNSLQVFFSQEKKYYAAQVQFDTELIEVRKIFPPSKEAMQYPQTKIEDLHNFRKVSWIKEKLYEKLFESFDLLGIISFMLGFVLLLIFVIDLNDIIISNL